MKVCLGGVNRLSSKLFQRGNTYALNILHSRKFSSGVESLKKEAIILGIETSCDDTGIGIVSSERRILGESVLSQWETHRPFNGVVPHLAQGEHNKNIDEAISRAVKQTGITDLNKLDGVAVTVGPGMAPCLSVGVRKARDLARKHNLPLIPVNHLEGHILLARFSNPELRFPFLVLLLSGGHTQLLVCKGVGEYVELGSTVDDALGEAYDKVARILGIRFGDSQPSEEGEKQSGNAVEKVWMSGGEAIEMLSTTGDPSVYPLTTPLLRIRNCEFSFSGLKTAMLKHIGIIRETKQIPKDQPLGQQTVMNLAASFQVAVVGHLKRKTKTAIEWCFENLSQPIKTVVLSGGVAKNKYIRSNLQELASEYGIGLDVPPFRLCTDNGVMIAWAGIERFSLGFKKSPYDDVFFYPHWPLDPNKKQIFPSTLSSKEIERRRGWVKEMKLYEEPQQHETTPNN
eukprot:TRINITY_DN6565_c0_g1_i1.p1 TRINITY_DN6565_c0_g1~~TRINITY_DN6565_c0_g1_i1.p1  ORF type:complete len:457 (-),score=75.64 TRINITY_DN6565_c0_g1_i1:414-1784(-)